MLYLRLILVSCLIAFGVGQAVSAQEAQSSSVRSPVLVIDTDLVFNGSLFGQRVLADVASRVAELEQENLEIVAQLAEESALAEQRSTMSAEDFRAAAEAFEAKTESFRTSQQIREDEINAYLSAAREQFDRSSRPILGQLMREREAAVLLSRRDVLLYFAAVDVTEEAIVAIDNILGDGSQTDER
jgi:Skp family chaperone for outer membrane proteins